MTLTLLSRHPGAIAWARSRLQELGLGGEPQVRSHLNDDELDAGDVVCGVLPLGLAAKLSARGVRVLAIDVALPEELRGVELSDGQLRELGAQLVEYRVQAHKLEP
jgi:putative CRISPR-associated protein (TIGR02620 family)